MKMDTPAEASESEYPGVEPAFDFIVVRSYEWMIARLNAIDARIQGFLTVVTSVTLAVPAFVALLSQIPTKTATPTPTPTVTPAPSEFSSGFFEAAVVAFAVTLFLTTGAWLWGFFKLPQPETFYEHWLDKTPWQFKKDLIAFAGEDFVENRNLINRKGLFLGLAQLAFLVELVLLMFWLRSLL